MVNDEKTSRDQESPIRFGLLIDKFIDPKGEHLQIRTESKGFTGYEIAILVEAWLEKFKENLQKPIKDNMAFFKKDK